MEVECKGSGFSRLSLLVFKWELCVTVGQCVAAVCLLSSNENSERLVLE